MIDFDFVVLNFLCCFQIQSVVVVIDLTSKILLTNLSNNDSFEEEKKKIWKRISFHDDTQILVFIY